MNQIETVIKKYDLDKVVAIKTIKNRTTFTAAPLIFQDGKLNMDEFKKSKATGSS